MKDFTHPTWVKIVLCAAPKNSRVPSSPCVRPVAVAWFPKAGVHRLCRTARSDPTVAEVVEESYTALFLRVSRSCARTRNRPKPSLPQSSGFFGFLGKRNPLAAFKEEPHKRQQQHKF
jgi:hypothetical protein